MPGNSELTFGQSTDWQPERPRLRVLPLVLSSLAMGIALMVAAGTLPGVGIDNFLGALFILYPSHLELPPARSSVPRACMASSRAGGRSSRAAR